MSEASHGHLKGVAMTETKSIIGNPYTRQIQEAEILLNQLVNLEETEKFKNEKQNRNKRY